MPRTAMRLDAPQITRSRASRRAVSGDQCGAFELASSCNRSPAETGARADYPRIWTDIGARGTARALCWSRPQCIETPTSGPRPGHMQARPNSRSAVG